MTTPLLAAVRGGHTEIVRLLLPFSDINQIGTDGLTALHIAVILGHSEITQMLLSDNRIDVNQQNADGKTALHLAIEANQAVSLDALLGSRPISHL
jgi:ankyrin repeat protein